MRKSRRRIGQENVESKSNDELITSSEMENEDDKGNSKRKKTPKSKSRKTSPEMRRNISPTNRKRAETTRSSSPTLTTSETTSEEDPSDTRVEIGKKIKKKVKSKNLTDSGSRKPTKSKSKSSLNSGFASTESSKSEESKIDTIPESAEENNDSISSLSKSQSSGEMRVNKEKKTYTVDELTEMLIQPQESLIGKLIYIFIVCSFLNVFFKDKNFINTYILTHQYFIESPELLRRLIDFYHNPGPHITEEQLPFYKMRIINVLKKLIEFRYYDLKSDKQFCTYLNEFVSKLKQGEESERTITKLLESSMVSCFFFYF